MYNHELQIGQRVEIPIGFGEEVEGMIVKLWNQSAYITVMTDDGVRFAGPEYTASLI